MANGGEGHRKKNENWGKANLLGLVVAAVVEGQTETPETQFEFASYGEHVELLNGRQLGI